MYNREDDYNDYSTNELARLSVTNRAKHDEIINSNLAECETIEQWQQRNLESAQDCLRRQRNNEKI